MKLRLLVPLALVAGAVAAAPASASTTALKCVDTVYARICVRDDEICVAPHFIPIVEQCYPR